MCLKSFLEDLDKNPEICMETYTALAKKYGLSPQTVSKYSKKKFPVLETKHGNSRITHVRTADGKYAPKSVSIPVVRPQVKPVTVPTRKPVTKPTRKAFKPPNKPVEFSTYLTS